jgi:hypothetical protein
MSEWTHGVEALVQWISNLDTNGCTMRAAATGSCYSVLHARVLWIEVALAGGRGAAAGEVLQAQAYNT